MVISWSPWYHSAGAFLITYGDASWLTGKIISVDGGRS
jgi:hypothetical protein